MEPENEPLEKESPNLETIMFRFHVELWGCIHYNLKIFFYGTKLDRPRMNRKKTSDAGTSNFQPPKKQRRDFTVTVFLLGFLDGMWTKGHCWFAILTK